MTREEAITGMQGLKASAIEWGDQTGIEMIDMAIEALKFQEVYDVTINAVNKYYDEHHAQILSWTPCSERLPEDDEIMLVTCKPKKGSPNVNRAYYMDGAWHGSGSMSNVTAWMPLPKPYQEDSK